MITFQEQCAQGDVVVRRIARIPAGCKAVPVADGQPVVIAHSETQHHHAFVHGGVMTFECDPPDPLVCYLRVERDAVLEHLRPFDTHAAIAFAPGDYEIRRQREYVPDGWRRVED